MGKDIINKEPLSLSEVKSELEKIKKRDEELNFRSNKTLEYLKSLKLSSKKEYKEIHDKLTALEIPRLKEQHIKKIIDLKPVNVDDLKMILSAFVVTVNQDNMKKIMDVMKDYS